MNLTPLPELERAAAAAIAELHAHLRGCWNCPDHLVRDRRRCRVGLLLWRAVRRALERWDATQRLRELARRPRIHTRGIPVHWIRDGGELGAEWTRGTWTRRYTDAPAAAAPASFDRGRPYWSNRR